MHKVPQTIGEEVSSGINALLRESDRFQDWNADRVLKLRRSIDQLQKADARHAFISRGQLAAICGNVAEVIENYGKALLHPDPATSKPEFWSAMGNIGLYSEAREIGIWLLEPRHGFYPKVWERAMAMGQPMAVLEKLHDAQRTWPELKGLDFSLLERAVGVMRERNLTDDAIVAVLALMGEVQREHGIMFSGQFVTNLKVMRPPEEPPYLYFAMPLATTVAEIHAMNRELAKLVVRKVPHGAFPDGLVMSFEKATAAELRAAA